MATGSRAGRRLYDISPAIGAGAPVWPGDSEYRQEWSWSRARGDSVNVARLTLSPHTGAHADAPLHVSESVGDAASLPLDRYWGGVRVLDRRARGPLRREDLAGESWQGIERALFRTRPPGSPLVFDDSFAYFEEEAARFLVERGLRLVGIDTPSVDPFSSKTLPAHRVFVGGGVAILESLDLAAVEAGDYELVALPLALCGADASPVRAVLRSLD